MKYKWSGLAALGGLLLSLTIVAPGCVVRARARVRPAVVVVDEQPPEPRYEAEPAPRVGYVWVRGHWEWRSGRWHWKRGYWKASRQDYVWQPGHWERRGNRWHWIEGQWVAGGGGGGGGHVDTRDHRTPPRATGPTSAPPASRCKNMPPRRGKIWQCGRWEWRGNKWMWREGGYVDARSGYTWQPGHWERQGNAYVWVEGQWVQEGGPVERRDHREGGGNNTTVPSRRGR